MRTTQLWTWLQTGPEGAWNPMMDGAGVRDGDRRAETSGAIPEEERGEDARGVAGGILGDSDGGRGIARERLVDALLSNAPLQVAVDAAEGLLGAPLALQDLMHEPIAVSSSYPRDDLEDRKRRRLHASDADYGSEIQWILDTVATGRATLRSWPNIRRERMYCGCLNGGRLFAFIRVVDGSRALADISADDVEFAARVLATVLLTKGYPYTTCKERWPSFLWNLLEGDLEAASLIEQPFFDGIGVFRAYWSPDRRALLEEVVGLGESQGWFALSYQGGTVALADDVRVPFEALSPRLAGRRAGASAPFAAISGFKRGVGQARRALEASEALGLTADPVRYESLAAVFALADAPASDEGRAGGAEGGVSTQTGKRAGCEDVLPPSCAALLAHDRKKGGGLLRTAYEYLAAGRDAAGAAETLHVHKNTVAYRLERARSLYGLDLSDPVAASTAHVSLLAWLVSGGSFPE